MNLSTVSRNPLARLVNAIEAAYLRRLIAAGEQHIEHSRAQIAANQRDLQELRVRLALATR